MDFDEGPAGSRGRTGSDKYIFDPFHPNHNLFRGCFSRTSTRNLQIAYITVGKGRASVRVYGKALEPRLLRVATVQSASYAIYGYVFQAEFPNRILRQAFNNDRVGRSLNNDIAKVKIAKSRSGLILLDAGSAVVAGVEHADVHSGVGDIF